MPGLLDVILGYDCNLACDYCTITPELRLQELATGEVLRAFRRGRALDYDHLSLTGGEPTIRPDLVGLVRAGRRLGFRHVKLQSNGLMFASRANVARMVDAGVDLFHLSIHTHEADRYDRLVRRPGTYPLMVAALDTLVEAGVDLVVDVILKEDTYRQLPAAVEWLDARGCRRIHLWFVSLTDGNAGNVGSMPRMTEVVPYMAEAFRYGREHALEVTSLHVPRCLLGDDHPHAFDPGAERVMVVTPRATFELKDSRLTGSRQVPACDGCRFQPICPGFRPDYLERYGDGEVIRARRLLG